MSSYEKINYSLRPAKQIERKMICEAVKCLHSFGQVEAYQYIGFGSPFFCDFSLLHRKLNISRMISIEKDEENQDRFEFNKPFGCIEMKYKRASSVLPTLDWERRSVVWLDYDGMLDGEVASDVGTVCAMAPTGSMLIVSVNSQYAGSEKKRLELLRESVGAELIPIDLVESDLAGWNASTSVRKILTNVILDRLRERNGGKAAGSGFEWKQVLSFEYADGAKMTTIGGVLIDEGHALQFRNCGFDTLSFSHDAPDSTERIVIPPLTYRELQGFERQLPCEDLSSVALNGVPAADLGEFAKVYRYFPHFAEAEM